ncbi:UPF0104 family protein [Lusitaniella coriacea]|uniref:UPF0104 family protein n=1 Tax=Lusitaniella coriacea TaxID=1983105 RepID=UPI003CE6C267
MNTFLRQAFTRIKPYLRWLVLGGILFFLVKTIKDRWQDAIAIRIDHSGWMLLAIAFGFTLIAHMWSGCVWGWILREFNQPAKLLWSIRTYLKTNIAKYLPGNVWHYYGRIKAAQDVGASFGIATVSVLLEPLLMAAAALAVALICAPQGNIGIRLPFLCGLLVAFHPRILNPILNYLAKVKGKKKGQNSPEPQTQRVKRYPLIPLLGEIGFVGLRGTGFLFVVFALYSLSIEQIPAVLSAFCIAWLLGLVVPGAPGGIGVFEATAIALLEGTLSSGLIISIVILYRLIGTLAEALGAGLAWLNERWLVSRARSATHSFKDLDT